MKEDLKKELKQLYAPSREKVAVVDVPRLNFAMVDGQIEPGKAPDTSDEFKDAIDALYGVSFTLKFTLKRQGPGAIDYTVMPLEGLWWTESGAFDFERKDEWRWTLMIAQPEPVTEAMFRDALSQLERKGDRPRPALKKLRFEAVHEGLAIQTMHVGPYAEEPMTIAKMQAFAEEHGYRLIGKHHEIYLGDPRRAKPERLKTILRHPVEKAQ